MTIYKKGITHAGRFHADEVFGTALLRLLCPEFEVSRVFSVPENTDGAIIYDIGGGRFDHHFADSPVRENGIPYAAFGLLWREYGGQLGLSESSVGYIDRVLVSPVDESDNMGTANPLSLAISSFNPPFDSEESVDSAFMRAVDMAYTVLSQMVLLERKQNQAEEEVLDAYRKMTDKTVVLERFVPWTNTLFKTDALFVVFPSLRGGFNIQGVPLDENSGKVRVPFPEGWCGASEEELRRVSGIDGLTFCHHNGFLAAVNNVETALSVSKAVQEYHRTASDCAK